ncbi:MAG: cytochrome c3 family protein [Planctomycetes bacterium]|nr:cytochrome c3 family protein [Planctomycetota bacterium]
MKHAAWLTLLLVAAALVSGYVAILGPEEVRAVAAPPLKLDAYLDEKLPEASEKKSEMKVDNFACYVCHGNYEDEELVLSHGKVEVGCIDCHGKSYPHRNDEDNITPPDKMYPLDTIDKMCGTCHETHNAPGAEVVARWKERCPAKTDTKEIVCTDCHYKHRLERRTVRWDKKTGRVLSRDEKPAIVPPKQPKKEPADR